ncbi:MAG: DUF4175 family protein [Tepidisphaeraceae bacterium]
MAQLPTEVRSYLDRFASRRRRQRAVRAVGAAVVLTIACAAIWCLVDRVVGLHWAVRLVVLVANGAAVIAMIARSVVALFRRIDASRIAVEVERREPRFAQRLATVTSRALGPMAWRGSTQLLEALGAEVAAEMRGRDPADLLPWWRTLRPWMVAIAAAAVFIGLSRWSWLNLPVLARRYFTPLAHIPPVTSTRLTVLPGSVAIAEGDTLVVRVTAVRLGDAPPTLHVVAEGQTSQERMTPMQDGSFEARLRDLDRDLQYWVTGGDAQAGAAFDIRILRKPAIARFRIRYVYPPYTRLTPREIENTTGQIEGPAGTEATVVIEVTEPLKLAVMTIDSAAIRMSPTTRPRAAEATITLRDDRHYAIRMASAADVSSAFRGGSIRAIPDRPPVVQMSSVPAVQAPSASTPSAAYRVVDDYGLARLDAEMNVTRTSGEALTRSISIPIAPTAREVSGTFTPDAAKLGLSGGERVELRLRAEDRAGQFDVSPPVAMVIPSGATPAPAAPSTTAATVWPASQPVDVAPQLDPQGFGDALKAYFDALRSDPR